MTTKVDDLITAKLRTASITASEDDIRRVKSSLKAAFIVNVVEDSDTKIANTILDKAIAAMQLNANATPCPRCATKMVNAKLATRRAANYCTACRVVTPSA